MSSKLFINGRTYQTRGARPLSRELLPLPVPGATVWDGDVWKGPHGLNYRRIDKANFEEGWIDAATFAEWLKVSQNAVGAAARAGVVDCAVERGSTIPLFRVTNPHRALVWARKLKTAVHAARAAKAGIT
jgi:hypothetical protein